VNGCFIVGSYVAAWGGLSRQADIAKLLIDHGVPTAEVHKDGYMPIHRACWGKEKRHTDTVKVFLDAGIAADTRATDGRTCAEMTQNKFTKKLLKRYQQENKADAL
jgi:ankyrin repeat protein